MKDMEGPCLKNLDMTGCFNMSAVTPVAAEQSRASGPYPICIGLGHMVMGYTSLWSFVHFSSCPSQNVSGQPLLI